MAFRTKLDYSDNRQISQRERTFTNLVGGSIFGVAYSAMTTGVSTTNSGTTYELPIPYTGSTFSGNGTTTIYTWFDSRMEVAAGVLSALTSSNSGETQETGNVFVIDSTAVTEDGYVYAVTYSGANFDVDVTTMYSGAGPVYTGTVTHYSLFFLSAASLDYSGRTIWVDNPEITRTKRLIITNNPQPGYALICDDTEGEGTWQPISAVTSGVTFWEETGTSNTALQDEKGGHSITGISDNSIIAGGSGNTITSALHSAIIGGKNNLILSGVERAVILGGIGITATTGDTVYVPDLVIDGLASVDLSTNADGLIVQTPSDATLKTKIKTLESPLEIILNLRGVSYEWTEASRMGSGKTKYGFIAQEVQNVIPEMVTKLVKQENMLTLDYKELIPWVVGAVQELAGDNSPLLKRKELILETQTIVSEDNNIELNFNGSHDSALDGGITVIKGIDDETNSVFEINSDGDWTTNNYIISHGLVIPEFSPSSTNDEKGKLGEITRDNDYIYIKRENGWGRTGLETF